MKRETKSALVDLIAAVDAAVGLRNTPRPPGSITISEYAKAKGIPGNTARDMLMKAASVGRMTVVEAVVVNSRGHQSHSKCYTPVEVKRDKRALVGRGKRSRNL